ncbi:MAG: hypothetical protein Alis3KO_06960 [Aliiglaciecola sp.]
MYKSAKNALNIITLTSALFIANVASATIINGTGDITPDVIFGSGNANGSWSGEHNVNLGIEVGLRAKLRYDATGSPQNIFNYDGDRTYTFDPTLSVIPAGRSVFNFEYAVNVDTDGSGDVLSDYTYLFEFDLDPTAGVVFSPFSGDIITLKTDNSLGNNSTGNGGGTVDVANYASLLGSNNVAQNSLNRGFGFSGLLDPAANGIFTYNLSVLDQAGALLASSSIDVVVGPTAVSAPGATLLFALGLAGMFVRRVSKRLPN